MMYRRFNVQLGRPLLILGGLLLSASLVQAAPVSLGDNVLDRVTAGSSDTSGSGGAIVGNSSQATINQTGGVDLSGEAQKGAKGLNLVNSAESTVANGVNIWDVRGPETGMGSGVGAVEQLNVINQEQRRSASMPNYSRPNANTNIVVNRTGSEDHNNSMNRDKTIYDFQTNTRDAKNTSNSEVDTTIKGGGNTNVNKDAGADKQLPAGPDLNVDTNVGKGLAVAGQTNTKLDGGEVQIGLAIGGAVIAHADQPRAGGSATYGGMNVGDEKTTVALYGRLILPSAEIEISGAGCGVAMGSCKANGTADLLETDTIDKNKMDKEVSSSQGKSQFTDNSTESTRSAFALTNAQAEYIVVDDSTLTVSTTFNLSLSGSAQSNVTGMNVVNATGSAVANGVNIARTSMLVAGGTMNLSQTNMISHSR